VNPKTLGSKRIAETLPELRSIKLILAYDGTAYVGWQRQRSGPSLQAALERSLARITGEKTHAVASGRTDAGVHALGQVVSFHTQSRLSPEIFQKALNSDLPRDMAVVSAEEAPPGFHAIRHAVRKRYRYVIHDGSNPDVFGRNYAWHYRSRLNAELMHQAARGWLGTHDFRSFESHWPQRRTSVRTIFDVSAVRRPPPDEDRIDFEVQADGFLYNMVRTMVGTLVEVGRGYRPVEWPAEVVAAQLRKAAGMKAPAHGLFLVNVDYE
jgi:tRNA pseudouridine38-40 synthase